MKQEPMIWIVDDDASMRWVLDKALTGAGWKTQVFDNAGDVLTAIESVQPDAIITDIRMPGTSGLDLVRTLVEKFPTLPVIVMTAHTDMDNALAAYREGAFEYLPKPFDLDDAVVLVRRALEKQTATSAAQPVESTAQPYTLIGEAQSMQAVFRVIGRLAGSHINVLICGESGTGKELVARAIYANSPRSEASFIAINSAAIPAELLESELFGHEKGAFTGADEDRMGLMEQAGAGTLFLDDIDDASLSSQACLLRALQEKEFTPLGSEKPVPFGARVVSASKVSLKDAVEDGSFREDLYYRLAVVPLVLPPLRQRGEDLGALLGEFLQAMDPENRYQIPSSTLSLLRDHEWPGNTRELRNSLVRALALYGRARVLKPGHFFPSGTGAGSGCRTLSESVSRAEKKAIQAALTETGGRKQAAAEILGISRKVLWKKCKDMGLTEDSD